MSVALEAEANVALQAKEKLRQQLPITPEMISAAPRTVPPSQLTLEARGPAGRFFNLESIRLRWVKPNWFEFIPKADKPFSFQRANGEKIEPRRMFTDGGSIPRFFRWGNDLDPWGFAPAYLVHDWEFDLHHCRRTEKSFDAVRDTMMEAVQTLIDLGICPSSPLVYGMIYAGIDSIVARNLWDARPEACPLPPDRAE